MARHYRRLDAEISRVLRNYNAKISRLEKVNKDFENKYGISRYKLPNKISKQEFKESYYDKNEIKRQLKNLQLFSKRGAETYTFLDSGVSMSKYELEVLKKNLRRARYNTTKKLNEMLQNKVKVAGVPTDGTLANMGDKSYLNLVSRKSGLSGNINKMSYENIKNLKKLVNRTNRSNTYYNSIFKDNYIDIINKVSYHFGTDSTNIINKLNKLKPEDFYKLFTNDKAISSVLDYYMVLKDDIDVSLNQESANNLFDLLNNNIDEIIKSYG